MDQNRRISVYPFAVVQPFGKASMKEIIGSFAVDGLLVLIDTDSIFGQVHLASSIMHAARAILQGEARAREPSIEVLRWLSGSHQVSRGIFNTSPGERSEKVLLLVLPRDWPSGADARGPPDITESEWSESPPDHLKPLATPVMYGRDKALERLGLGSKSIDAEEMEKAVLEAVCMPALK